MTGSTDLSTSSRMSIDTLSIDPFTSLRFQFGMLLGVEDFEGLAANPRGKLRLHNAWLHKKGVVWGYGVGRNTDDPSPTIRNLELQVEPGLAFDGRGRELYSASKMCVDVGAWYQERRAANDAPATAVTQADGSVIFNAHVVISYRTCLRRPVPAIVEPCEGDGIDTTYSRVSETVLIELRKDDAPAAVPAMDPYRHVAVALSLKAPQGASETNIATRRDALRANVATTNEEWLALFRDAAGRDRALLRAAQPTPGTTLNSLSPHFPELEEKSDVVIAEVKNIRVANDSVDPAKEHWVVVLPVGSEYVISYEKSPTLLPTSALQEMLELMRVRP